MYYSERFGMQPAGIEAELGGLVVLWSTPTSTMNVSSYCATQWKRNNSSSPPSGLRLA